MEASNSLTSRVVLDELDIARDVDLVFFFENLLVLFASWLWTVPTAVMDDILNSSEETRVTMELSLSVLRAIPFGIQQKVFGVEEFLDLSNVSTAQQKARHKHTFLAWYFGPYGTVKV